jgi:hypothetical protein
LVSGTPSAFSIAFTAAAVGGFLRPENTMKSSSSDSSSVRSCFSEIGMGATVAQAVDAKPRVL